MWKKLLVSLLVVTSAAAKRPAQVPQPPFRLVVPAEFTSPAPDQWVSPDGGISLCWSLTALNQPLEDWARSCQTHFPGNLTDPVQPFTMDGRPGWTFAGQSQGRMQRIYLAAHGKQGFILICSCRPTQNFAAIAVLDTLWREFHWNQGN